MNPFDAIYKEHISLIEKLARQIAMKTGAFSTDNLVLVGCQALWESSLRFNPDAGTSIWQYAYLGIRGAMIDEIRISDHISRLERKKIADESPDCATWGLLFRTDLLAALNVSDSKTPLSLLEEKLLRQQVYDLVENLQGRERFVIESYYIHHKTLKTIASDLNFSEGRVCQLKKSGLQKMKDCAEEKTVEPVAKIEKKKKTVRLFKYKGEVKSLREWSISLNMSLAILRCRLERGWDVELTLSTPVRSRRKNAYKIVEPAERLRQIDVEIAALEHERSVILSKTPL
jgi:RNA polymerase sigma factor for flagellar operon FliA